MVKNQRKIEFTNDCGAIVDFPELEKQGSSRKAHNT